MSPKEFVVVGGGISGLAAAHRLAELSRGKRGSCRITLLEASPRFGGLIETRMEAGFLLESGPDSFLCENPWALDLCRRLGLEEEVIQTHEKLRRSFVVHGDSLSLKPAALQPGDIERWYAGGSRYGHMLSLKRGLRQLVEALVQKMPEVTLRRSSPVSRIERRERWVIVLHNRGESLPADAVCIALPAAKAAIVLSSGAPELNKELNAIPHESVATVNVAFRKGDVAHPLDGFGFVVPAIERRRILGATFSSVKFPDRAPEAAVLIRAFVGGAFHRELVDLDDAAMKQMVVEELRRMLGVHGEPILVSIRRHPQAMPQYELGHLARVAAIEEQAARYPGLYLTGNAYRGVGIPDCIHQAEMVAERMVENHRHPERSEGSHEV